MLGKKIEIAEEGKGSSHSQIGIQFAFEETEIIKRV